MKLTGRLLVAFALAQLIAVLCGLTVDGSESFCFHVNGRSVVDLGAVMLITMGFGISRGSRQRLSIAAFLSLFFTLSAMYALTMTAISGIGQMSIWQLLVILVVGLWSTTNLLLLVFLCDLKSSLPRYSLRTLLILVLLLSIGFKGLRWMHDLGQPPPFASVSAIEQNYQRQIQRLLELAQDEQLRLKLLFNDPGDIALFSDPEILEAKLESPRNGYRPLGEKTYHFESRFSAVPRQPGIGAAVANLHWDKQPNGSRRTVLEYHLLACDNRGNEVGAYLVLDFSVLEQKAAGRAL